MKSRHIIFAALFIMIFGCVFCKESVKAKTYNLQAGKTNHIEVTYSEDESDDDDFHYIRIPFSYCYFTIQITNIHVQIDGKYHDEYVKYVKVDDIFDTDNEYYASNGTITFRKNGNLPSEDREFILELDTIELYYAVNDADYYSISCDITVSANSTPAMSETNITCYLDNHGGKTVKLKNASNSVTWSITNKKIASISKDDNQVTVYPKKIGTCYVKAKSGGKTYKCKVKVKGRKYLYAGGTLESYSTRSNIFVMKFKNCSNKTVKIKASDAIAVDSDYISYDRNLKLGKTISVKPGSVKRLKFKVIGRYTWYNVNDFCINYTVIYKGKKYRMASDTETTWIRRKGKWKELLTYDMIGDY
ncbi:MAG: hypothetical protein J1F02_06870 [Lachnospiraceae bacterium]|nr:hypothetical protein [Lachnospiraceae bacterium]